MRRTALFFLLTCNLFCLSGNTIASEDLQIIKARQRMVDHDLKGRDITDVRVLEAMGRVPRHLFVDKSLQRKAYEDYPLPIGEGQTISQPYIVALMTQALKIKPGDRVLEIGTGSGYQAAVLAELTDQVYTIELREGLAKQAAERLNQLGYGRVKVKTGDGYMGWEEYAPFDGIMVTCAIDQIPPPLIQQLREGGRLVIPVGSTTHFQTLTLLTKKKGGNEIRRITGVVFVPMVNEKQKSRLP